MNECSYFIEKNYSAAKLEGNGIASCDSNHKSIDCRNCVDIESFSPIIHRSTFSEYINIRNTKKQLQSLMFKL
ncbi:MAG: hypothetical protein ACI87N_001489 [Flavobacteriales bacterium]|jgi:hypothetical protein